MSSTTTNLVAVIAAVFIPPLGVALDRGINQQFWISLILTLLFFVPGLIYSLYVILK
ncbi:MAG: YqaE/Pmp3 family membrane protein [Bacteroidota bacterium]